MRTSYLWDQYMRWYNCKSRYTEPYNPQQNSTERAMSHHKDLLEKMLILTGCDTRAWFKLSNYISEVQNRIALKTLEWRTPLEIRDGETPDISAYLLFSFWEKVYYMDPDSVTGKFPNNKEKIGRWLGVTQNHGDTFCFYILTEETEQIIVRGTIRSAEHTERKNKSLFDLLNGDIKVEKDELIQEQETGNTAFKGPLIKSGGYSKKKRRSHKHNKGKNNSNRPKNNRQKDDVSKGRNVIKETPNYGALYIDPEQLIDKIVEFDDKPKGVHAMVKERINEGQYRIIYTDGKNELFTYQEIIDNLNKELEEDIERWTYDDVSDHRWKKGNLEVLIKWDTGEMSWEPIQMIKRDDPITLMKYAKEKGLLGKLEWRWVKRYVKNTKKLNRMYRNIHATKKKKRKIKYKFGIRVPRNLPEAYYLDQLNGNTK